MTEVSELAKSLGVTKQDIVHNKLERVKQKLYDMTCESMCKLKKTTLNKVYEAITCVSEAQRSL